ncbi:Cercarial protease [Fasciola hepatica]|uniref:Cercarial protease n=1 Tax=Fasciola hepatica TaxID=6192 RepID=A0A4E0RLI7_FASHE|nr:Cercarial protease [Fasciola hepatica]
MRWTLFLWIYFLPFLLLLSIARAKGLLEYRVQNGFVVAPGEFPSVVLLTGKVHRCTGTLVALNKVLTAGHCACGDAMTDVFANVTTVAERFQPTAYHRRIRDVAYPVSYAKPCEKLFNGHNEDQNMLGGTSDIAVLTTDKPFVYIAGAVEFERLNLEHVDRTNKLLIEVNRADAMVLGFGKELHSQTTGLLRFGYIALSACPDDIQINTTNALCASVEHNLQPPDVGDSGGPLINSVGQVIGVTSISGDGWIVFASVHAHIAFIGSQLN